jgi:Protein of unknown function (DUF2924)
MQSPLDGQLAQLRRLDMSELRTRYAELFGEPTTSHHRLWLVRRIAWRLQALAEGDLSQRARQRAQQLAHDADLRLAPPPCHASAGPLAHAPLRRDPRLPMPGTILMRPYKGATLQVKVLAEAFQYEGKTYKSLSAVAKAITGSHANGFLFFGLVKEKTP